MSDPIVVSVIAKPASGMTDERGKREPAQVGGIAAPARRDERLAYLAAAACVLLAHLVRNATDIGARELWLDEASTYWLASHALGAIPRLAVEVHSQPPLYYFVLHGLLKLGTSEWFLRGFSFLCTAALVAWLLFGRVRLTPVERLATALLLVSSDFTRMLAQELRPYALAALLAPAATAALLDLRASPTRRGAARYAALMLALLYTLAFAAWVLAAHGLCATVWAARGKLARRTLVPVAIVALVGAGYLPFVVAAQRAQGHVGHPALAASLREIVRPEIYANGLADFVKPGGPIVVAAFGVACVAFVIAWRHRKAETALWLVLAVGQVAFVHGFMKGRNWIATLLHPGLSGGRADRRRGPRGRLGRPESSRSRPAGHRGAGRLERHHHARARARPRVGVRRLSHRPTAPRDLARAPP